MSHAHAYAYLASHLGLCGQFNANCNFFFYILYSVLHQELRSRVVGEKIATKLNWLPEKGDLKLASVFFNGNVCV